MGSNAFRISWQQRWCRGPTRKLEGVGSGVPELIVGELRGRTAWEQVAPQANTDQIPGREQDLHHVQY